MPTTTSPGFLLSSTCFTCMYPAEMVEPGEQAVSPQMFVPQVRRPRRSRVAEIASLSRAMNVQNRRLDCVENTPLSASRRDAESGETKEKLAKQAAPFP